MASILGLEYELEVIRGSSRTIDVTLLDPDGTAMDLTGATVYFTVKDSYEDSDLPKIRKSSANALEISVTSPRRGEVSIFLVPRDTHNLDVGREYLYDIWVVLATGERFPALPLSPFKVLGSATRIPLP